MNKTLWRAQAPANIALIKYMGKTDKNKNMPTNVSLSYTLPQLLTTVELEIHDQPNDIWQPMPDETDQLFELSSQGQTRFLSHLQYLKQQFSYDGCFTVRSTNNFPSDCGLASSASSFAALTLCACQALADLTKTSLPEIHTMAAWSRHASGSSCRSLFQPWALWRGEDVVEVDLPQQQLIHHVVVIDNRIKRVSSSQAHERVPTSSLFTNRPQRAEQRLDELLAVLKNRNWRQAYLLIWQEFWDMHALFETANPPFGYLNGDSVNALQEIRAFWGKNDDGPLVTMDAGPNIHLLFRQDQEKLIDDLISQLKLKYQVL